MAFDSLVTLPNATMVFVIPVTVPVNAGLANIVAFDSLVTLPKPTIEAVIPVTVPVNAGFVNISALLSRVTGFTSHVIPFQNQVSVPTITVSFITGLLGKFIAMIYPICYI